MRACVHELQLCHISQRDGRNTECRQIEALLSLRFVLSSCVCVSPRCCYVTVLILIGFDSFRCWWKYPDHMCIDLCVFWFNAHVIWNQLVVFLRTSVLCLCFTVDMAAACFHCGLVSWLFSRLNEQSHCIKETCIPCTVSQSTRWHLEMFCPSSTLRSLTDILLTCVLKTNIWFIVEANFKQKHVWGNYNGLLCSDFIFVLLLTGTFGAPKDFITTPKTKMHSPLWCCGEFIIGV